MAYIGSKRNIAETMNTVTKLHVYDFEMSSRACKQDITLVKITVNCTMVWT